MIENRDSNFDVNSPFDIYMQRVRAGKDESIGIVLFKPGCPSVEKSIFSSYCKKNSISILLQKSEVLSHAEVAGLYPRTFSFSKDDLCTGIEWKHRTMSYFTSAPSDCLFLEGARVQRKLQNFKYRLRKKYNKISSPTEGMSEEDIIERVIKNHIHVVDGNELQYSLWLLFGYKQDDR